MLETICEVMKHSYDKGMISTRDGNVSIRHADSCLLYTSPSPRDRQKSRMPSSA